MNSELEILKKFWENDGETYIRLISNQAGFGIDYTRYICNSLLRKGQIEVIKKKRDWYRITSQGKKELKLRGIIKPEVIRKTSKLEKVTYYLSQKLETKPKKIEIKTVLSNFQKVGPREQKSNLGGNLVLAREEKLNLGKKIEKAVAFLRNL